MNKCNIFMYVKENPFRKENSLEYGIVCPKSRRIQEKLYFHLTKKNTILVHWQLLIKYVSYRSIGPTLVKFIEIFGARFFIIVGFSFVSWNFYAFIRFEVISTVNMKVTFFGSVTPYLASLWEDYIQHIHPGVTRFLRNLGRCRLHYKVSHHRSQ